jgi:hypothetical protein
MSPAAPGRNQRSRADASATPALGERANATASNAPIADPVVLKTRSATFASRVGRYICSDSMASDKSAPVPMPQTSCRDGPRQRGISPTKKPKGR